MSYRTKTGLIEKGFAHSAFNWNLPCEQA